MLKIDELKTITKKKGLTYPELSELSGVPLGTLRNLFSGRIPNPGYDTICAIYDALGLNESSKVEEKPEYQTLFESLSERNQTLAIVYMQGLLASEGKGLAVVIPMSKNAIN